MIFFNSIRAKVYAICSVALIGMLLLTGWSIYNLLNIYTAQQDNFDVVIPMRNAISNLQISRGILEIQRSKYILTRDTSYFSKIERLKKKLYDPPLEQMRDVSQHDPALGSLVSNLLKWNQQFEESINRMEREVTSFEGGDTTITSEQLTLLESSDELGKEYYKNLGPIGQSMARRMRVNNDEIIVHTDRIRYALYFITPVLMLAIFLFTLSIVKSIGKSVESPRQMLGQLAEGVIPKQRPVPDNEIGTVVEAANKLAINMQAASQFAADIGEGRYETKFEAVGSHDTLGNALVDMRAKLKEYVGKQSVQQWHDTGVTQFSDAIQKTADAPMKVRLPKLLGELIRYLQASQGAIFLLEGEQMPVLEMRACYALNRRKFLKKQIMVGEGLVGQTFLEQEPTFLTDLPSDYLEISSGLGKTPSGALFILPLNSKKEALGVLEISFLKSQSDHVSQLSEKMAEMLADMIFMAKNYGQMQELLNVSQEQTEKLKQQEEELRQNAEEMLATQEELQRRVKELEHQKKNDE